ncbi:MAG: DNA primase catalytic subunit PriS [Candidatus Methanomethylophilaceae archaeon]|nr:DNA primase catalytic subunit PriS [Candidatus Methanomethylophilaceae archaeon]
MDQNLRFLLKTFRKYYKEEAPIMPPRFARREFGFMFFDKNFMQRHTAFSKVADLRSMLQSKVPSHCYYSTAYYRKPGAPTMEEKEWLGADLIFDLDADHLAGAEKMTYSGMLEQIRKEMANLVDSFLLGDLGFSEEQVQIVFSGGRGYHAHVDLPDVLTLGTHERREIVDYITVKGLNIDWVFPYERTATSTIAMGDGLRSNVKTYRTIPLPDSGGWRLRMRRAFEELVEDVCAMEPSDMRRAYPSLSGVQAKTLINMRDELAVNKEMLFRTNSMVNIRKTTQDRLIEIMRNDVSKRLSGEVDEPVTADIKRLIRLPGSLHGKTGLRVVPLSRTELDDFDPLMDAVPIQYSDEPVQITMRRDYDVTIRGERFSLSGTTEVPEYAAVFLIGRKEASIGDGTAPRDGFF